LNDGTIIAFTHSSGIFLVVHTSLINFNEHDLKSSDTYCNMYYIARQRRDKDLA
jgi:hypothetical protein